MRFEFGHVLPGSLMISAKVLFVSGARVSDVRPIFRVVRSDAHRRNLPRSVGERFPRSRDRPRFGWRLCFFFDVGRVPLEQREVDFRARQHPRHRHIGLTTYLVLWWEVWARGLSKWWFMIDERAMAERWTAMKGSLDERQRR
ncbi:MAG: hypothetical protein ACHQE6_11165, partial [Solirubrobacterales bacterium]